MSSAASGIVLRMIIRKVNVASAAKVGGTLYAIIGLIIGVLVALISMVAGAGFTAAAQNDPEMPRMVGSILGAMFGAGAILFFPILYGVMGVIFGALIAALYNLIAGITGGLSLDVD
jgi:hypothetical protein